MANEEHLKILGQGVEAWNEWRKENSEIQPDLSWAILTEVDLKRANLRRVNFTWANLSWANLKGAFLYKADLRRAILFKADLTCATLIEANLSGTDLRRTNLEGAKLFGANLQGAYIIEADLSEADLKGAMVGWSIFGGIDLSVVRGLDTLRHFGPSTIGIDTLYRSKDNIPSYNQKLEVFLRGAGVPDDLIDYMTSLVSKPYYACMVCYSDEDRDFNDRFYADLRTNGVRAWYFRKDAKWGEPVWGEIDRSIKDYDKVVVICSENSLQSGPVLREIERALQREDREGKNVLFPIRIDDYIFDRWEHPRKADVVSKVVGDFRGWDQNADRYEAAFEKLLEALEAEG